MADIATFWSVADSRGDWALDGPDLAEGADIITAVIISLFTDRQAETSDIIPDGGTDPRGWWGDLGGETLIGSRLWLLDRAKQTDATLANARVYAEEALRWLVADQVVARVTAVASWVRAGFLGLEIVLFKPDGETIPLRFESAWGDIG
jgi:phage gp46-like protein